MFSAFQATFLQRSWKRQDLVLEKITIRSWKGPAPGFGKDQPQVLEKTMTGGRGGARHQPKPWIDVGLLYGCLEKHQHLLKDFGTYEHVSTSSAPNPKALLKVQPLWSDLVALEPSGLIHSQPLRQALLSLLSEVPSLNQGNHSGQVWCNLKIERLTCILTHCRKLKRESSTLTTAAGKLTRLEYESLTESLKKIKLQGKGLGKDPHASLPVFGKAQAEKRQLVPRDSDVTMSDGIPSIFQTPASKRSKGGLGKPSPSAASGLEKPSPAAASGLEKPSPAAASGLEKPSPSAHRGLKRPASSSTLVVSQQRPGNRLHAAMGYGLEKSKKKTAKQKAQPVLKRPACKKPASLGKDTERKPWVKLRQVDPQKTNPRSYIQGMVEGGKMHLIVEISQKMSPHYKALIGKIREALEKDNLTKEEALSMRAKLLKEYSGT